jgi:putative MATE family efflux protein
VASSLLQAVYGVADMLVISHYVGETGASATNVADQVMRLITNIVIGLSSGGGVLVGQYFGGRDKAAFERTVGTFVSVFSALGLLSTLVMLTAARPLLTLMNAPALDDTYTYLVICATGLFFVFGYNTLSSVLRAVGNSRVPLMCIIVASLVDVALDIIFVGPLGMGVAGAAWSTVIGQVLSFLAALVYMLRRREIFSFSLAAFKPDFSIIRRIFKIGFPSAIQMTVASISWLTVTFLINEYGVVYSAASGISAKIRDFSHIIISAMSVGTSAMIAQTLGAQMYDRARRVMYTAMKLTMLCAAALVVIVELTAPFLAKLFIENPTVIEIASLNLRIEILAEIFYASFLIYHSLMLAAGHTYMLLISSFVNCIVFRLILALWFNSAWGIVGVFAACALAPASSIPIGYFYTRSGIWRRTLAEKGE